MVPSCLRDPFGPHTQGERLPQVVSHPQYTETPKKWILAREETVVFQVCWSPTSMFLCIRQWGLKCKPESSAKEADSGYLINQRLSCPLVILERNRDGAGPGQKAPEKLLRTPHSISTGQFIGAAVPRVCLCVCAVHVCVRAEAHRLQVSA